MIQKKNKSYYTFFDLVGEVDKELGFDQRDAGKHFDKEGTSFTQWHKSKGYPEIDPEGIQKSSSQLWYSDYQKDISSGKIKKDIYMDFWHYQLDNLFLNVVSNDSMNSLYVGLDDDYISDITDWQLEIQKVYHKLFYDISDDGWIQVEISW